MYQTRICTSPGPVNAPHLQVWEALLYWLGMGIPRSRRKVAPEFSKSGNRPCWVVVTNRSYRVFPPKSCQIFPTASCDPKNIVLFQKEERGCLSTAKPHSITVVFQIPTKVCEVSGRRFCVRMRISSLLNPIVDRSLISKWQCFLVPISISLVPVTKLHKWFWIFVRMKF